MAAGRYGVLLCAEEPEFVKRRYGGYREVFMALMAEEGEAWEVFRARRGELPSDRDISGYDGFVITGSYSDAHGDEDWIIGLVEFLRRLHRLRKRVLGVCFGHQILCRALGGKTGRSTKGWDIGVTNIHLSSSARNLFSSLQVPSTLSVIEFHRDEVKELPFQAEVLAWSEKTGVEIFRYGDHILGIQGHPEYSRDIILNLVDRLLRCNLIQNQHGEAARASLDAHVPDCQAWKRLCKGFLKGNLWSTRVIEEYPVKDTTLEIVVQPAIEVLVQTNAGICT